MCATRARILRSFFVSPFSHKDKRLKQTEIMLLVSFLNQQEAEQWICREPEYTLENDFTMIAASLWWRDKKRLKLKDHVLPVTSWSHLTERSSASDLQINTPKPQTLLIQSAGCFWQQPSDRTNSPSKNKMLGNEEQTERGREGGGGGGWRTFLCRTFHRALTCGEAGF